MAAPAEFKLLGQTRFKLLLYLVVGPRTPTELASLENKHLSDVSRSLAELRRLGLVEATPSGSRERYYRITRDGYIAYSVIAQKAK
jgi:DNA-binding MarR family transcriptional regulator